MHRPIKIRSFLENGNVFDDVYLFFIIYFTKYLFLN